MEFLTSILTSNILNFKFANSKRVMAPINSAYLRLSRFIKLLEVTKSPEVIRSLILAAPDNVIKEICNIALNCYKGDFTLSPKSRKKFLKSLDVQ